MIKKSLLIILGLLMLVACAPEAPTQEKPMDLESLKQELMQVDRDFSSLAEEKGTVYAFHHYLAEDGLALSKTGAPRTRSDYGAMLDQITAQGADERKMSLLSWDPILADVAASGDLGYTHGRYELTVFQGDDEPEKRYGYYVSIWKKQASGEWRFVFDAGNEAEEAKEEPQIADR